MAASDSTVPFSLIDGALVLTDGSANSHTVAFVQTEINWAIEGAPWAEARTRNKHHSTPTARKTGDGTCSGSLSALVCSMLGSAAPTLYEVLTFTGGASAWTTVGAGDKKMLKAALTGTNASGATQTISLRYCIFTNVKVEPGGADGLWMLSADFTDLENEPLIA